MVCGFQGLLKYMINKHMKGCTISLVNKGLQIKITMRYHYTPTGILKIERADQWLDHLIGWVAEQLEHSYNAGGNVKQHSHFGK